MWLSTLVSCLLQSTALAIEPPRQPYQPTGNGDKILTWNETFVNSQFGASRISVSWLSGGEDGQYVSVPRDYNTLVNRLNNSNGPFMRLQVLCAVGTLPSH